MAKSSLSAPVKSKKAAAAKSNKPTHEQIAQRAFEIYLERGSTPGDPMQDWLRAEMELSLPAKKTRSKSKVITFAA